MKTFQKIALVSAIAAAPFAAQAGLTPMDDASMSNTTGQAGVTIEINIAGGGISVGEIEYTDTASGANDIDTDNDGTADTASGGSVKLQNLVINNVNGLTQTIDVANNGDLILGIDTALTGVSIELGKGGDKSAVLLQSAANPLNQAELINDLNMTLDLGKSTTIIRNMSSVAAGAETYVAAGAALTQSAFDTGRALVGGVAATQADVDNGALADAQVDSLANSLGGIGVIGGYQDTVTALAIQMDASFQITDLDVGMFGYTAAQSTGVASGLSTGVAAGDANSVGRAQEAIDAYNATPGVTPVGNATSGTALDAGQQAAVAAVAANGAAVQINDLQFYGGTSAAKTAVSIEQTIWAQGGSSEFGGGVYMQIGQITGTLDIGAIEIGGASIGQVKVSNINLAGMTQRIYGH